MQMLNCLIIDDEPLAREGLTDYVKQIDYLTLVGACQSAMEASTLMAAEPVDLLLLDIQMPRLSGLDFLRSLTQPPMAILTTAFPSFALEGYQLEVIDYLVKPITFDRFFQAIQKAQKKALLIQQSKQPNQENNAPYFFIKCDGQLIKVKFGALLFVESMQNYVQLYTLNGRHTALVPLKQILDALPNEQFLQVHKSFVIAIDKIDKIEGNRIHIGTHQIPVSRNNKALLIEKAVKGKIIQSKK